MRWVSGSLEHRKGDGGAQTRPRWYLDEAGQGVGPLFLFLQRQTRVIPPGEVDRAAAKEDGRRRGDRSGPS